MSFSPQTTTTDPDSEKGNDKATSTENGLPLLFTPEILKWFPSNSKSNSNSDDSEESPKIHSSSKIHRSHPVYQSNSASYQKSQELYTEAMKILQEGPSSMHFSRKLLEESAALGNPEAMYELGQYLLNQPSPTTTDSTINLNGKQYTPLDLIQKAASMDHPPSLMFLGDVNLSGSKKLEIPRDRIQAIEFYERAANYDYTPALSVLGTIYSSDVLFDPDIKKSIEYLTRSCNLEAIQGDPQWASMSLCTLSRILMKKQHESPESVPREQIIALLSAGVALDNSMAMILLGDFFIKNYDISKSDREKFIHLTEKQLFYRAYLLGNELARSRLERMGVYPDTIELVVKQTPERLKPQLKVIYEDFLKTHPKAQSEVDPESSSTDSFVK